MTTTERSYEALLGRADVNDLDAILSVANTDRDALIHTVTDNADALFTWNYDKGERPPLAKLYEKAKTSQWNAETDLDWSAHVDQEAMVDLINAQMGLRQMDLSGSPFEKWGDREWTAFGVESQNWTLSQFLHGEQGALLCTAKIVEAMPWIDAKYYAATQVMDEARHVAFGVLSLKEFYEDLTDAEIAERQEFAFEAAVRMRDRFLQQEVYEAMGVDPKVAIPFAQQSPYRAEFQRMLFTKIVPNCKKLGLLDRNDAWLRRRFEEINVIEFEDWADTGEEYLEFALSDDEVG